jgi:hypothetical protein
VGSGSTGPVKLIGVVPGRSRAAPPEAATDVAGGLLAPSAVPPDEAAPDA